MVRRVPQTTPHLGKNGPRVVAWGRLDYSAALARQLELWEQRRAGRVPDTLAVVEHGPVITLGRHAPRDDILLDHAALQARGIAVARSDRGGRATYHGPGQAVVYPIVGIAERGMGVKDWVALLEAALTETLKSYGVEGRTVEGRPGIWVGDGKIASLGLRVARGVSYHGVSINVERRSVEGFAYIVTCGIADQRVTSIMNELKTAPDHLSPPEPVNVEATAARFCRALIRRLSAHGQS
jgi:lipoate-protein ligase B